MMVGGLVLAAGLLLVWIKAPELLVTMLLVGQDFVQFAVGVFGFHVSRMQFAVSGGIIFGAIVVLVGATRLLGRGGPHVPTSRQHLVITLLVFVFAIIVAVGLTYTPSPVYGTKKFTELLIFGVAPFILCFVLIRDLNSARRLVFWIMLVTLAYVTMISAHTFITTGSIIAPYREHAATLGGVEVSGGWNLEQRVTISLAALMAWVCMTRRTAVRRLAPLLIPGMIFLMIASGARTAVVNIVLFAFIAPFLVFKRRVGPTFAAFAVIILLGIAVFLVLPEDVTSRLKAPLYGRDPHAVSGQSRLNAYRTCIRMITESPLIGGGTGGFSMAYLSVDYELFPHNMFLESWAETGFAGFVVVLGLWFLAIRGPYRIWKRHHMGEVMFGLSVWMLLVLINEFGNGMFHYGVAHAGSTFLITVGIIARTTYLIEREEALARTHTPAATLVSSPSGLSRPAYTGS